MDVIKICQYCGAEYKVPHWRVASAKYCSRECSDKSKRAENNVKCTTCGKMFHLKRCAMERYSRNMGYFCSRGCANKKREEYMSGAGNHQYGLKGNLNASYRGDEIKRRNNTFFDVRVFCPHHPFADKSGRVLKHRLLVEQNHNLFDSKYFQDIDGFVVLRKEFVVHHKDGNHSNNELSNLEILTKGQHVSMHNKMNPAEKDKTTGRFIKRNKKDDTERISRKSA